MPGSNEHLCSEQWQAKDTQFVMRPVRWSDAESYGAMQRELYEERVMAAPRNADFRTACEMIGKRLTDMACGSGILLVVEADDRIVAEGTLQRSNGDGSITLGLLVLEGYRDRGIGRRLMAALETEARRLGRRRIDLTVWGANDRAYHLYASMGYREMGRFPDWNRSDLAPSGLSDHVWMIRDLQPQEAGA